MDDPIREEITFSARFPLPFRVLFLGGLGVLGWATNLHGLSALGIDAASALELSTHQPHRLTHHPYSASEPDTPLPTARGGWKLVPHPATLYGPVYRLFFCYAIVLCLGWACYQHATRADVGLVDVYKFVPGVLMLFLLMMLVSPFDVAGKRERDKFLHSIRRCLISKHRIHFSDVVFADIFTSFAKVLGDVWLSVCMILPGGSLLYPPPQQGLARWILPTLMSIPYAVRFRQCLVEYSLTTNESKRPLYNAIKYATSFPVIFLSAAQRQVAADPELLGLTGSGPWYGEHSLFRLWLLSALINSLYSFWWDVTYDWGFDLLRVREKKSSSSVGSPPRQLMLPRLHSRSALLASGQDDDDSTEEQLGTEQGDNHPRPSRRYPYGLRSVLLLPLPVYPFAILVDLVLRLTWSAKLSSHLHSFIDEDRAIFFIEFLEMARRWMWVFLRVEWEVVREREVRAALPPGTRLRRRAPDASAEAGYEMLGERESRANSVEEAGAGAEAEDWRKSVDRD
ncbi:uncharacterized protein PHACADRAFT_175055 [Phanerochaete carnosa HHB-10118-sp]|uniref:EXS domain-containing protein n=1 Tax=Phanerochaete carnosa (strain HHB-10118-sp) TaxID=650164 RepID=K5VSQ1_PHACS|nr:uncharacterized protein PHACADRAFT_175055 [Phanerochaete carnosa HHB-10118-sp]EKM54533.1 hypothetical protein PHACADRAFT_175055 [Phanerochaete carnosa HHB-10118-sp]